MTLISVTNDFQIIPNEVLIQKIASDRNFSIEQKLVVRVCAGEKYRDIIFPMSKFMSPNNFQGNCTSLIELYFYAQDKLMIKYEGIPDGESVHVFYS